MQYNQLTVKNQEGLYIQYPTAYDYQPKFTNGLYDVHLWNLKEGAEKLANYLMNHEGYRGLKVVKV